MKDKIIKNKEVLHGINFDAKLNDEFYNFKIIYVNDNVIKIAISFNYSKLRHADSNSFEGIIKRIILETCPNNNLSLDRQATISRNRLKNIPIIVDGNEFRFEMITNSQIKVVKFIKYEELLNSQEGSFLNSVLNVIEANLIDNPPKSKPIKSYGYGFSLFGSSVDFFDFKQLGHRRVPVSEKKLEENREKFKEQRKKEKRNMEKMENLEKELNLNKKQKTRDLARYR